MSARSSLLAHPLSPDLDRHATQLPLFPEPPPSSAAASSALSIRSEKSEAADPLFPASPKDAELDESVMLARQRTVKRSVKGKEKEDRTLVPSFPSSTSLSREASNSTSTSAAQSSSTTHSSSPSEDPLPKHLTLAAPPHLLPSATLAALPSNHLIALVQALSLQSTTRAEDLARAEREVDALAGLAREGGVSAGEVERGRVRARVDSAPPKAQKEWRIELLPSSEELDVRNTSEVVLNLDDLTSAIADDAFAFDSPAITAQPTFPDSTSREDDTASISSARSAPAPLLTSTPSDAVLPQPIASKQNRARHASLSSRIFGSFNLASSVVGSGASSVASASSSPPRTRTPLLSPPLPTVGSPTSSPAGKHKKRHGRSDSLRSVESAASNSSNLSGSRDTGEAKRPAEGGYSEWIGWKGWGRNGKEARSGKEQSETGSILESAGDEQQESLAEGPDQHEGDEEDEEKDMTTPMPSSSAGYFGLNPSSPSPSFRRRGQSDASSTSPHPATTPPDSLLSAPGGTSIATSADELEDASTVPTGVPSPPMSPASSSRRPSQPDSPTMSRSRPRGISAPAITAQHATASSPSIGLSAPIVSSELSKPGDEGLEEALDEEDQHAEGESTIKARRRSSGSRRIPASLSVATPSFSAAEEELHGLQDSVAAGLRSSRVLGVGSGGPIGMTRSLSDGLRRVSGASSTTEPNLTLFPKLSALSRYSPFAQPALSTPSTQVSLSSHSGASLPPSASSLASPLTSAPTTMELSTISGEAAPPTLAALGTAAFSRREGGKTGEDGPMVDRYGFVHDVRSGMKLLREARRRKERLARGDPSSSAGVDDEDEDALRAAAALIDEATAEAGQDELEKELEAMRVAMGLPASVGSSPTNSRSPAPRSPIPSTGKTDSSSTGSSVPTATSDAASPPLVASSSTSTTLAPQPRRPVQLVRSPSSSDRQQSGATPGVQSMKLLLTTLKDMSDALENTQKIAWESFIRRRQLVLAKGSIRGGDDDKRSKEEKKRRKRAKDRPRTVFNGTGADAGELVGEAFAARSRDGSSEDLSEKAWAEDLVGVSQMGVAGKSGKEDWAEFKDLVRKGVPIAYRPKIWAECSGANEAREPGLYQDLLAQHKSEENQCLNQIDMDCHRTFPTNVFFAGNGPGVAKLRNVLIAYSWRNPKIGYCQGMNNLTATLLLTHPAEEDAFWVLVCIIEKILPSDYYTSHLLVSQADQRVLRDLIQRLHPEVADHLEELGVELPAVTFGWFLSLFTDALPIQTLLRVWDLIFVLGTVMLFRVAVAIIQMNRDEILQCDSAASLYALMRSMTTHLYQVDKLLKIACEDLRPLIKDRDISVLRSKHVADLQLEMGLSPNEDEGDVEVSSILSAAASS